MLEWVRRATTLALLVLVGLSVAGCSLHPVCGDNAIGAKATALQFSFADPTSRLEQIVYQELRFRFSETTDPDAPRITIRTTSTAALLTTVAAPGARRSLNSTVTGTMTVTVGDATVYGAKRVAMAGRQSLGGVLSDTQTRLDAEESAAKSVAESLRLAILSQFAVR